MAVDSWALNACASPSGVKRFVGPRPSSVSGGSASAVLLVVVPFLPLGVRPVVPERSRLSALSLLPLPLLPLPLPLPLPPPLPLPLPSLSAVLRELIAPPPPPISSCMRFWDGSCCSLGMLPLASSRSARVFPDETSSAWKSWGYVSERLTSALAVVVKEVSTSDACCLVKVR